jgi:hypothetical protein
MALVVNLLSPVLGAEIIQDLRDCLCGQFFAEIDTDVTYLTDIEHGVSLFQSKPGSSQLDARKLDQLAPLFGFVRD